MLLEDGSIYYGRILEPQVVFVKTNRDLRMDLFRRFQYVIPRVELADCIDAHARWLSHQGSRGSGKLMYLVYEFRKELTLKRRLSMVYAPPGWDTGSRHWNLLTPNAFYEAVRAFNARRRIECRVEKYRTNGKTMWHRNARGE